MNNDNQDEELRAIDIEKRMNHHWAAAYMAQYSAEIEEPLKTVAYKHLLKVAQKQRAIADALSNLILAYIVARDK